MEIVRSFWRHTGAALTVGLTLWAAAGAAQESANVARDQLIREVENEYVSMMVVPPDSPIVSAMIADAMKTNPGTSSDTWDTVRSEIATAMTKLITERGGVVDVLVRNSLSSMSEGELVTLSRILVDPTYRKFLGAMADPAAARQMQLGTARMGLQMGPMINGILTSHHLNEVH
jgi:hypothetical protein